MFRYQEGKSVHLPESRWLRAPWLLIPVVVLGVAAGIFFPRGASPQPALAGTILPQIPAPQFSLKDQFGHRITLTQLRGRPVLLTFMEAQCLELCPLVAETIHRNLAELGAAGKQVAVLVVSTDPEADTPAAVRSFSQAHGMYHRWLYLTAGRRTLTRVWQSYYIFAAPANAPAKIRDSHSSGTYLIDAQGRERVFMGGDPDGATLRRDLLILSGLPVEYRGPRGVPAPEVGHPAPAFALAGLTGGRLQLSSVRGKVVLLNFWATWCKPCKAELPRLSAWYRRLRGQGFTVIGIDEQEGRSDVAGYIRHLHVPYPILLDENGNVAARYNIQGTPSSLLLDRHGIITETHLGPIDDAYLATHAAPLVAAASAS
jgi:cytochrome oxidase Cu insertion factor (SCO1/SenC/PrrC family)